MDHHSVGYPTGTKSAFVLAGASFFFDVLSKLSVHQVASITHQVLAFSLVIMGLIINWPKFTKTKFYKGVAVWKKRKIVPKSKF